MKYDIVRYVIDLNDSMLYFLNTSEDTYETQEQVKSALSEIIKKDSTIEYDGLVHFYAISDLPSMNENNGVITMTFYASATLDNVTKGKVAEYAKNHRMDCHFI